MPRRNGWVGTSMAKAVEHRAQFERVSERRGRLARDEKAVVCTWRLRDLREPALPFIYFAYFACASSRHLMKR